MVIEHKPIEVEMLEHVNNYYEVVFIPEGHRLVCTDVDGTEYECSYEVRNRKYGCCEYRSVNLPNALSVAEQFNAILVDQTYKELTEEDIFVKLDSDTGGGSLQ